MELWEIRFSPACGRVRFALDAKGLRYKSRVHTPMLTDGKLKKLAGKAMVPILVDGSRAIQGSDEILAYLEDQNPEPNLLGRSDDERQAIRRYVDLFQELIPLLRTDLVVRARQDLAAYSKESPLGPLPAFLRVPLATIALNRFSQKWKCQESRVDDVRARVLETLRSLAPRLRPGKHLVASRLTDADIAIAELTLLFRPPERRWIEAGPGAHKVHYAAWVPADVAHPFEVWRDELYRAHRRPIREKE